jgi:hypothetical protein
MTDDLISQLTTDLRPVPARRLGVWLLTAILAGAVVAFVVMVPWIGLRADLPGAFGDPIFWTKFAYTLAFAVLGLWSAERLSRPGGSMRLPIIGAIALVVITGIAGLMQLMMASPNQISGLIMGGTALVCPFYILALSVPLFAAITLVMRRLAPTNLTAAGFASGLAAGAASCWVYAFHCGENGLPFITLWYTAGILGVALVGAFFGRYLLRW